MMTDNKKAKGQRRTTTDGSQHNTQSNFYQINNHNMISGHGEGTGTSGSAVSGISGMYQVK